MGREMLQIHINKELRNTFKKETKTRCMDMSKVISLFMERFVSNPKEAMDFLFNN